MDAILSPEQEELLKRTRNTLGDLRDILAKRPPIMMIVLLWPIQFDS